MEPEASEFPKGLVLGRGLEDLLPWAMWDVTIHPLRGPTDSCEFPESLVLGRGGHVHIRLRGSTPLGDVGCNNPPPLRARRPCWHTSCQGLALIPNCHIPAWAPTPSRARLRRSTILSTLGPNHSLTVLFLGTHTRTSQGVTHLGNALTRTRLTSEFRWNPKSVCSQKASC
ncbi:hypothetical protein DVH24_025979 [Malus domestica]|uniref:Uncharacterized protein n=1 Tax=Malus domestica TaxID=3750 RepID=A0A498KNF6_MALDO|nr:hypothetical protein DVH24_025979 [Malus domestica]